MKKVILATLALIAIVFSCVNIQVQHEASVYDPTPTVITTGTSI